MVLVFLVLVWVAVLAPWGIRRLRQGYADASIDSFHEQLHLLERTGPKLVQPAYRLTAAGDSREPDEPERFGEARARSGAVAAVGATPLGVPSTPRDRQSSMQHQRSRRRRRDVVVWLGVVVVASGVLGSLHSLHALWVVTFLSAAAIAAYVALAAYAQMLNAENEALKPVAQRVSAPPMAVDPPWLLRMPRHACSTSHLGVEVMESQSSRARAARSGFPGAWDEDAEEPRALVSAGPRHAAVGG